MQGEGWIALGLFALLALSGGSGSGTPPPRGPVRPVGPTPPTPHTPRRRGRVVDPVVYGRSKARALRARWDNASVRSMVERFGRTWFPGIPDTALIAFSASSTGPYERGGPPDYVRGDLGIERAYRDAHGGDERTHRELGRSVAAVDGPAWYGDREGQWYLGLRRYRDALDSAAARLRGTPLAIPTRAELVAAGGTGLPPWAYLNTVTAYSSGAGILPRLAGELARAGELNASGDPWLSLGRAIAAALARGESSLHGVPLRGRWHAAHAILRAYQRLESGRALAMAVDDSRPDPWYPDPLPPDLVETLTGAV